MTQIVYCNKAGNQLSRTANNMDWLKWNVAHRKTDWIAENINKAGKFHKTGSEKIWIEAYMKLTVKFRNVNLYEIEMKMK